MQVTTGTRNTPVRYPPITASDARVLPSFFFIKVSCVGFLFDIFVCFCYFFLLYIVISVPELSIIIGLMSMNLELGLDRACTFYTGWTLGFGTTDVIYVSLNIDFGNSLTETVGFLL